ncbi:hypothetical protein J2R95_003180 [Bradyrhizobium japonicum]|uniref:hypothetical protein n=1 Tax=Bradyrhizobium japonicum TaxID=375 RepID=UPI00209D54E9|nr:hypothetical protein [Bradyrhizobium japonicum]MCP1937385.1 hypothetical protein [Bradyrhizobium japonicum]
MNSEAVRYDAAQALTGPQQAQARSNIGAAPAAVVFTNTLAADIALNNTSVYFDGPAVAQGTSGTFLALGQVTINDASTAVIVVKLWDGATVIASSEVVLLSSQTVAEISLSGICVNPAGNIRISVKSNTTTGKMGFNLTGNSKDCTLFAYKLA